MSNVAPPDRASGSRFQKWLARLLLLLLGLLIIVPLAMLAIARASEAAQPAFGFLAGGAIGFLVCYAIWSWGFDSSMQVLSLIFGVVVAAMWFSDSFFVYVLGLIFGVAAYYRSEWFWTGANVTAKFVSERIFRRQ
ncbi:hypothetical protein LOC68_20075 [Blastopirellula sp. JC732]|uniref:Uncharacterized protein n=1 Tax=Blastopirellula sediminis TaxID=2894196 RepID=A0A9X1MQ41_9BACT|nr:hypothetical protein [Blastopirellula sediminis]MCC9606002.1 hypothetical protein [Blastopirellula sediminis]MCC9630699.1 hypothetical protein [Blastopirellula sediminis]